MHEFISIIFCEKLKSMDEHAESEINKKCYFEVRKTRTKRERFS